jgi:transposase-like protein
MRKNHSVDIKIKAVLKASRAGITASEVAEELGIHTFSLCRWKKELRDAGLLNKMPKEKDLDTDLELEQKYRQLQKENEHLRMENAVLKILKEYGETKRKKPSK